MPYDHHLGTPCWVEHRSADPVRAAAFYSVVFQGAVLGWRCLDKGPELGHYHTCWAGSDEVAGIGPGVEGQPAAWRVYLAVDEVEAVVAALEARGGKQLSPVREVGSLGRMCFVADPSGAPVGLWQAVDFAGFTAVGSHGAPAWFDLNTRQGPELSQHLVELFGLERQKQEKMQYWNMLAGGRARFGVLQMNHMWEGHEPHWMSYFAVDDLDAACRRVEQAGGTMDYAPFDTPFGRIAILSDPLGAAFSLVARPA